MLALFGRLWKFTFSGSGSNAGPEIRFLSVQFIVLIWGCYIHKLVSIHWKYKIKSKLNYLHHYYYHSINLTIQTSISPSSVEGPYTRFGHQSSIREYPCFKNGNIWRCPATITGHLAIYSLPYYLYLILNWQNCLIQ